MRNHLLSVAVIGAAAAATLIGATSAQAGTTGHSRPAMAHTVRVVVRPVESDGTPAPGYAVTQGSGSVDCSGNGTTSPVAVDPNIRACYPDAAYALACWKSTKHSVLCLDNPRVKKLIRFHYKGDFGPNAAPKHPIPLGLDLGDGNRCGARDGGAWGFVKQHPKWLGFYICRKPSVFLYGTGRDGIDHTVNPWLVHTVKFGKKTVIANRRVTTAYYVGTAS